MTKQELLSMEEYEILDYLRDHCIDVCTDIDEELEIWWEYASGNGWTFTEAVNTISGEEYMHEDYEYIILEDSWNYPRFSNGFNDLEQLIEYYEDDLDLDEEELEEEQEI